MNCNVGQCWGKGICDDPKGLLSRYADENRLRQYVQRWFTWLHGGLRNRVSNTGGFNRIWLFVLKHLNIGN
jgi:hypothetical protein